MTHDIILQFDNVSHVAEDYYSVIDLSFSLPAGDNLVIFGLEESGINLICPLITGIITDFEGDICFQGKPIKNFDYFERHNYRTSLGYVQRSFGLINNMSVRENIELPLKYHSDKSSDEIAAIVDGHIRDIRLDHCSNMRPVDLMNSDMLKTAYARAIALNPPLILIEHGIEGQCLLNIQAYLDHLKRKAMEPGVSFVIITFAPSRYADFAEHFIMLHNGNMVFSGDRNEYLKNENPYLRQYLAASREGPMRIL
jgi:ABC-type transporter Mla maintaining outer membrane lipid asymmetry ATPase subunit MlaF